MTRLLHIYALQGFASNGDDKPAAVRNLPADSTEREALEMLPHIFKVSVYIHLPWLLKLDL